MSIIGVPARRRIAVVSAGLSQPSSTRLLADQLADAARRELERGGAEVEIVVVELRELAHDIVNNLLTGFPSATLRRAVGDVSGADALVAVTPIFNASYSGLFKSFVDVLDPEALVDMPVLVGATGGTVRHSLALEHAVRPLFVHLRAVVAPTSVYAASADWGSAADDGGAALADRIQRAGAQLAGLVVRSDRERPVDAFSDVTPFADLLAATEVA